MKVELGLSNYATKIDLKGATSIDLSDFGKNTNLASLKLGFIKSNNNRPTNYPPKDHQQFIQRSTDHRPTDSLNHLARLI